MRRALYTLFALLQLGCAASARTVIDDIARDRHADK